MVQLESCPAPTNLPGRGVVYVNRLTGLDLLSIAHSPLPRHSHISILLPSRASRFQAVEPGLVAPGAAEGYLCA
jgi:hypothetical protein